MMDLMAFPMEILIHIVMFIGDGSELSNLPFIKRSTIRNAINKRLTLVSPKTLCILSRVNKAFRTEFTSNIYWGPLMARDFRKGIEYKRSPKNCRKVYMERLILKNIQLKLEKLQIEIVRNQIWIKTCNMNIKNLEHEIKSASSNPEFINTLVKGQIYEVTTQIPSSARLHGPIQHPPKIFILEEEMETYICTFISKKTFEEMTESLRKITSNRKYYERHISLMTDANSSQVRNAKYKPGTKKCKEIIEGIKLI